MSKRVATAALWLFTVSWGWNYLAAMTGAPAALGLVAGVAIGLFVGLDPLHLFFARSERVLNPPSPSALRAVRGVE